MTTHRSIDSSGALTIKSPRENIFARARHATNSGSEPGGPTGPFDASAACAAVRIGAGGAPLRNAGRLDLVRWSSKVVVLAVLVVLIAAVAGPGGDGATHPQGPVSRHRVSMPPVKRVTPPAVVRPAQRVPRRVRRSRRKVPSRRERRTRPRPSVPPAAVTVTVTPLPPRPPVPKQPSSTSPRPAPVPAGAPPEFM